MADRQGPESGNGSVIAHDEAPGEAFRVIVGWSHAPFSHGIQLRLQTRRAEGRRAGQVEDERFLITRNQALILARYLLDASGQTLPERIHEGPIRRFFRHLTGG
ncbi:hypothetical protein ACFOD9_02315 [Novosphingobium bradum]|uniref:Uncharacterized protein n=1 Tax=Novosphingobium bradum TaxID=1737444 RepID=A0ABV7IQX9_9SPHN